ncbi:Cytochrome P450 87A3 [Dichanthelium oligosanthes]|uniref:Cytochrome P450 87A3 n=1 Tax=Dichanthelium oligosanthes TaxID=888268 RepID=A0A1E5USQ2_9POAL|nr:Cytochrome P450 87A3 [Dichanthelium oligosanthes]
MEEQHVVAEAVYALLYSVSTLVAAWLLHWVYRWRNPPCGGGKLPPGSMGFPIIGETFQFFRPSPSLDVPAFYKLRLKRYGPVFKTSLVGQPVVVSMDAELNRFIFQQEGKLFRSWYPETSNNIFGKESISSNAGTLHRYARSLATWHFGIENLKGAFLAELGGAIADSLRAWKLISLDVVRARELRKNFDTFFQGLIAFPLYLPGTTFYRCMQGRKKVQNLLTDMLKERLSTPEKRTGDLLDVIIEDLRSEKPVASEKFSMDTMAAFLFASFATISSSLTVAMKFLTDHPKVIEALMEEDKRSKMLKNFIPFGGGIRLCVGAEFSKVLIALFLHSLMSKYRWREIKGGDVLRVSEIVFPEGYHIQLLPRT